MKFSASVRISKADDGTWSAIVDGEEMSTLIAVEGFSVTDFDSETGMARVNLTLFTDDLEIDIPEAEVNAA